MVCIFSKEMVPWYLISRKLKEAVESSVIKPHDSNRSINLLPQLPIPDSDWIISVNKEMLPGNDQARKWQSHSIYRIPNFLKVHDSKSYIPQSVSIGPYHHGVKELLPMERHKWRAVSNMLGRTRHNIRLYFDAVRRLEDSARSCYEEDISLSSSEFVKMMTVDGIFILELLLIRAKKIDFKEHDPLCRMLDNFGRDVLMLENQIPLFILDKLYGIQFSTSDPRGKVVELASSFLDKMMPGDTMLPMKYPDNGLHFLDMFCQMLQEKPTTTPENETNEKQEEEEPTPCQKKLISLVKKLIPCLKEPEPDAWVKQFPCVKELQQAGVKFENKKNSDRFWDISFEGDTLKMPRLVVDYNTHSLLLNLVAYEQCHPYTKFRITAYVMFMDRLIDSRKDVTQLHREEIISKLLGSDEEVAKVFNDICRGVVFKNYGTDMSKLSDKINKFYKSNWNNWRAILKVKYFGNPWSIITVIAAVVVLILTFIDSFYTTYQYYQYFRGSE